MALLITRVLRRPLLLSALLAVAACLLAAAAEPKLVHQRTSKYAKILVADDDRGLRTLYFDTLANRQSVVKLGDPEHLELPYARTMLAGLAVPDKPRRMLVVGLGGGTLPVWMHRHFPEAAIDVVEIDPEVVDVAQQFFGFRPDEKLKAHVADGRKFIEEAREPYDVILLDAFAADSIPYHLATEEFLKAVRKALGTEGVAVSNLWGEAHNPLYNSMVKTYQSVFHEVRVIDAPESGNRILIALPATGRLSRQALAERGRRFTAEHKLRFPLGALVERGYESKPKLDPAAKVLKDGDERPGTRSGG